MADQRQRDMENIDPNALPIQREQRAITFLKHPEGRRGIIPYDRMSLTLNVSSGAEGPSVTNDKPLRTHNRKWVGDPDGEEVIPAKFLNRDQPHVGTCSRPTATNRGCFSHNGCPYTDPEDLRGRGPGPFNVVMVGPDGQHHPCPCYHFYHGERRGYPTSQVHYAYNGYKVDTEQITIPTTRSRMAKDEWGNNVWEDVPIDEQVGNLGPMYAHHFGKRKQRVKAEKPKHEREEMAGGEPVVGPGGAAAPQSFKMR